MSTASPFSSKESVAAALESAFSCPDASLEATLLSIYTKQSTITVNQKRMAWEEFLVYITAIRSRTTSVEIKSHHLLRDGKMFSERHSAYGYGKDGTKTQAEAMLMGELNEEGKAIWLEEIAIVSTSADSAKAS